MKRRVRLRTIQDMVTIIVTRASTDTSLKCNLVLFQRRGSKTVLVSRTEFAWSSFSRRDYCLRER